IRQIVDIALKALSPGINDTTTAVTCVDYLGAILHSLMGRQIPSRFRYENDALRVIVRAPDFEYLLDESLHQIRQSARDNVAILLRMLGMIEIVSSRSASEDRRRALGKHVQLIAEVAVQNVKSLHDREIISERVRAVMNAWQV
ncbi:MAG: DUF2254 family protein, partial [Verrucomicrobiota bacterium]